MIDRKITTGRQINELNVKDGSGKKNPGAGPGKLNKD